MCYSHGFRVIGVMVFHVATVHSKVVVIQSLTLKNHTFTTCTFSPSFLQRTSVKPLDEDDGEKGEGKRKQRDG